MMYRSLRVVVILGLVVLLCALMAIGDEEKLVSQKYRNKGLKMLRHRPWYSGKRGNNPLFDKVRIRRIFIKCFK